MKVTENKYIKKKRKKKERINNLGIIGYLYLDALS